MRGNHSQSSFVAHFFLFPCLPVWGAPGTPEWGLPVSGAECLSWVSGTLFLSVGGGNGSSMRQEYS